MINLKQNYIAARSVQNVTERAHLTNVTVQSHGRVCKMDKAARL